MRLFPEVIRSSRSLDQSTRLTFSVRKFSYTLDKYFYDQPIRQALWCFNSFGIGYYCANSISLSFGALAINDVVAAAVMVALNETMTYSFYKADQLRLKNLAIKPAIIPILK